MVVNIKVLFLTLEKYSLCITNNILLITHVFEEWVYRLLNFLKLPCYSFCSFNQVDENFV